MTDSPFVHDAGAFTDYTAYQGGGVKCYNASYNLPFWNSGSCRLTPPCSHLSLYLSFFLSLFLSLCTLYVVLSRNVCLSLACWRECECSLAPSPTSSPFLSLSLRRPARRNFSDQRSPVLRYFVGMGLFP